MKTSFLFLILLVITFASSAQTIRRVNNNFGVTGVNVYATAQAAHDAAAANDILIIEPSVTSYGDLTLSKPLKIYGNGYYLDTNTELKADKGVSSMGFARFNTGSGGSEISGVTLLASPSIQIHGVSNIKVQRCVTQYGFVIYNYNYANTTNTNVSNIQVSGNYFTTLSGTATAGYTISNVLVTNNIIHSIAGSTDPGIQNWIVRNNTFYSNNFVNLVNSVLENNLFTAGTQQFNLTNVSSSYNVAGDNLFAGGIGNQNNFPVSAEFIGAGSGISTDEAYQLKASSSLKTGGTGGTELGAYGGVTPYVVSGIPAIPSIVNMINTATGSNSTPLSVTITVKSNN